MQIQIDGVYYSDLMGSNVTVTGFDEDCVTVMNDEGDQVLVPIYDLKEKRSG